MFNHTFGVLKHDHSSNEANTVKSEGEFSFINKLIISKNSDWKAIFDIVMLFASVYNTFSQAYYAAFGEPEVVYAHYKKQSITNVKIIDQFVEVMFYLDFLFCFC